MCHKNNKTNQLHNGKSLCKMTRCFEWQRHSKGHVTMHTRIMGLIANLLVELQFNSKQLKEELEEYIENIKRFKSRASNPWLWLPPIDTVERSLLDRFQTPFFPSYALQRQQTLDPVIPVPVPLAVSSPLLSQLTLASVPASSLTPSSGVSGYLDQVSCIFTSALAIHGSIEYNTVELWVLSVSLYYRVSMHRLNIDQVNQPYPPSGELPPGDQ